MEVTKNQGQLIRGMAMMMIVAYHFQYDVFGMTFLVKRGQGFLAWIADIGSAIGHNPASIIGLLFYVGFIGVNVFFLLSGYGLMKKYAAGEEVKLRQMGKQMLKILIPYWLAHPLIHLIDWALRYVQFKFGFIDAEIPFNVFHSWGQYAESMLVVPKWLSNEGVLSFVGSWWFVAIILQFYLLFPILFKLFKRYGAKRMLLICVGVSFVYRLAVANWTGAAPIGVNGAEIWLFVMFPARLAEFALGMYLAVGEDKKWLDLSVWRGLVAIGVGLLTLASEQTMFVSDLLFAMGAMVILYRLSNVLQKRTKRLMSWIGEKSYLIYLYHEPTMKLLLKFIFPNSIN